MIVDFTNSRRLPIINQTLLHPREKGWQFSYVYSFEEMRDMYILLSMYPYKSLSKFSQEYLVNYIKTNSREHLERKALEVLNALVNFGWYSRDDKGGFKLMNPNLFEPSSLGKTIVKDELKPFQDVFTTYPFFLDFIKLYAKDGDCSNIMDCPYVVFSFGSNKRYTDSFFYSLKSGSDVYYLPEINEIGQKNSGRIRFWDVFVSWAISLGVMEKLNSSIFDYTLATGNTFSCSYFLSSELVLLPDIATYLKERYPSNRMIDLKKIVMDLCFEYRKSLPEVKEHIVREYKKHSESFNLVRTSEIFINKSDKRNDEYVPYPKYKGSYISHIIINV